jgi:release factor glutamine methyltransferase
MLNQEVKSALISKISSSIEQIYGIDEAKLIAKYFLADSDQNLLINDQYIDTSIQRLKNHEPLQYITGKAYFLEYIFYVNNHVLIPRPETEELVYESINTIKVHSYNHVFEVGTGSGCISISIKKMIGSLKVTAIDISQHALIIASNNADKYDVSINFIQSDFLDEANWDSYGELDLVVSNPPYISYEEQKEMKDNVLKYEPRIALFAGEDTLIFYKKLAKFSRLKKASCICELNEFFPEETKQIFINAGFNIVEIIQDMQGKSRILRAFNE